VLSANKVPTKIEQIAYRSMGAQKALCLPYRFELPHTSLDLHEDLIDVEGIAIATVLTFQSACINGAKLDAPETDSFSGYSNASFS
jgi:hypothetical protein